MMNAVLFDFDGVIVQSEPLHKETFLSLLSPYGVEVLEERWYREFAGTGSRRIFQALAKEYGLDVDIEAMVAKRRDMFIDYARQGRLKILPGLVGFLKLLREKNIKIAIVSGGHRGYIEVLLKLLDLDGYFEFMVTSEDIPERKPDPGPFLHAAKKLGVAPESCIVFEDSYSGCKSGKNAGMKVVWVRPNDSMETPECDYIISSFENKELPKLLD